MSNIERNLPLLQVMQTRNPKLRKQILKTADDNIIKLILECIQNLLVGNVPLEKCEKSKISRHMKILRKIHNSRAKIKQKQKLIIQSGGAFLPALLAPIVSAAIAHFL